jgi:hypothetical protein
MILDRARPRREPEPPAVLIQGRGEQVGGCAGHGAGARDVGQEARVSRVHRVLEHELAQVAQQLSTLEWLLGDLDRKRFTELVGPELAADRQLGQAGEQLDPQLDGVLPELPCAVGIPIEVPDGLGTLSHPWVAG